jgi:hypothetical protein
MISGGLVLSLWILETEVGLKRKFSMSGGWCAYYYTLIKGEDKSKLKIFKVTGSPDILPYCKA